MVLNPAFKGNRGVAGVAAGGAVLLLPPLPPATTWSTAALLWFRNFSSRRHFALRLLNHTCKRHNDGAFVTISVQSHTRRRLGISHHPHPFAFVLIRARSRFHNPLPLLLWRKHPRQSHSLLFHRTIFSLFLSLSFFLRPSLSCTSMVVWNLTPGYSFLIPCEQPYEFIRGGFSSLLIAIEQLSDGKLSYSCSLGSFPSALRFSLSRILPLSTSFYLSPLRCCMYLHVLLFRHFIIS